MYGKNLQEYFDAELTQDPALAARLRRFKVYFNVALQISKLRKKKGLTQAQLAKKLNTTQPNIARWETPGYDRYSLSRLIDIAEALGVALDIAFRERGVFTETGTWPDEQVRKGLRALRYSNFTCVGFKADIPTVSISPTGIRLNKVEATYA
jgi:transcriptional regulator with XRE-family HTH domain